MAAEEECQPNVNGTSCNIIYICLRWGTTGNEQIIIPPIIYHLVILTIDTVYRILLLEPCSPSFLLFSTRRASAVTILSCLMENTVYCKCEVLHITI